MKPLKNNMENIQIIRDLFETLNPCVSINGEYLYYNDIDGIIIYIIDNIILLQWENQTFYCKILINKSKVIDYLQNNNINYYFYEFFLKDIIIEECFVKENCYLSENETYETYGWFLKRNYNKNTTCCICLSEHKKVVKILKCGHVFHVNCINEYSKHIGSDYIQCPLCRGNVKSTHII